MSKNFLKNCGKTKVVIFKLEFDIDMFITKLLRDKLEKIIRRTRKVLRDSFNSISYLDIQLLVGFLFFLLIDNILRKSIYMKALRLCQSLSIQFIKDYEKNLKLGEKRF